VVTILLSYMFLCHFASLLIPSCILRAQRARGERPQGAFACCAGYARYIYTMVFRLLIRCATSNNDELLVYAEFVLVNKGCFRFSHIGRGKGLRARFQQYQRALSSNTVPTPHVKLLKPPTGISRRQHSTALPTMRKIIKRSRRRDEAVLPVSRRGCLHLLLRKIHRRIISIKLTITEQGVPETRLECPP